MSGFPMLAYSCRVCGERFAQSTMSRRCAESHAEPSADYERGRADALRDAIDLLKVAYANQRRNLFTGGIEWSIGKLESLR